MTDRAVSVRSEHEPALEDERRELAESRERVGLHAEPILVGPSEAARLLGISRTTLHELLATDRVPRPIELGKRCPRWSLARLRRWAEDEADAVDRFRRRAKRGTG